MASATEELLAVPDTRAARLAKVSRDRLKYWDENNLVSPSIKRQISGGTRGISSTDLVDSIRQEYREHEDLPNTTNPDDWAKISGKKGERIVYVRTLIKKEDDDAVSGGRSIERVATGQYL